MMKYLGGSDQEGAQRATQAMLGIRKARGDGPSIKCLNGLEKSCQIGSLPLSNVA